LGIIERGWNIVAENSVHGIKTAEIHFIGNEDSMTDEKSKKHIKHMVGVFASVFSHAGHLTKEEAKKICGLADQEFDRPIRKPPTSVISS